MQGKRGGSSQTHKVALPNQRGMYGDILPGFGTAQQCSKCQLFYCSRGQQWHKGSRTVDACSGAQAHGQGQAAGWWLLCGKSWPSHRELGQQCWLQSGKLTECDPHATTTAYQLMEEEGKRNTLRVNRWSLKVQDKIDWLVKAWKQHFWL